MATENKDFKVKNGLQVGGPTNIVNVSSSSPTNPFIGQLWVSGSSLYARSSASTWILVGDGNAGGGSASGTPINIPNTLVSRSSSGSFQIGHIDFDITASAQSSVARLAWDDGEGTLSLGLKGGNVNLQLGQENVALCYNGTGSAIANGQVVYISGAQGQKPSIALASAMSEEGSSKVFGVTTEEILSGGEGFVATFGIVNGVDTSQFAEGSALWLSASPGKFTQTKPLSPAHLVFIGYSLKQNSNSGRIFVNPQNGYELEELHDVLIQTASQTHVISYNSASGLWMNKDLQAAIKEVDGANSGIDADLLDGQQGSYYLDWTNTTNKPDPIIGVNLTGAVTGAASATLNQLTNGQVSITTSYGTISTTTSTSAIYRLTLSDAGKIIEMNSASANNILIPINASVAFPIGTKIDIIQVGAGATSASVDAGVTLNSEAGKRTVNAQWQAATLVKRATNTWVMVGALKA